MLCHFPYFLISKDFFEECLNANLNLPRPIAITLKESEKKCLIANLAKYKNMLVRDIKSGSTAQVMGLSLQLFDALNEIAPNTLVSFEDLIEQGLVIKGDEGLVPFCQPPAKEALVKFLKVHGKPITINNCWRSLFAQYLLKQQQKEGIIKNFVAEVGHSNHGSGTALDVNEAKEIVTLMQLHGWTYPFPDGDGMHFEFRQAVKDLREPMIKAFQTLWNMANPDRVIEIDGLMGDRTLASIGDSPAAGFYNIKYPRILRYTYPQLEGKDVGELQLALRKLGITVRANCVFDITTYSGVRTFQLSRKLPPTGVVDRKLRELLELKWVGTGEKIITPHLPPLPPPGSFTPTHMLTSSLVSENLIPPCAIALIKKFEGLSLNAYTDPRTGGEPITIGYGCTVKPDGSKWKLGDKINLEEAEQLLLVQLQTEYLPFLQKIPVWAELNLNQRGALLSFAYNLGANFYGKIPDFASITEVLENKEWDKIPSTFAKYCNPGSNVEEGLKTRRLAEAQLFLSPC